MQKTKDILKWYFKPSDYKYSAEHLFSNNTKNHVNDSIKQMKELALRLPEGNRLPKAKLLHEIYNLFQDNYKQRYSVFNSLFSKRDIRVLVWALDYQPHEGAKIILFTRQFKTAKKVIVDNWSDSFIISLFHVLLRNWNEIQKHGFQRKRLLKLLSNKCDEYNGTRKYILNISSNIGLFLKYDSPKIYVDKLLEKEISVSEAHSLINQKETVLKYEFYSEVINEYATLITSKGILNNQVVAIYQFLEKQNSKKDKLIICSFLINNIKFNKNIEIVKTQTVKMIGDPIKKHLWKYSGLTLDQEKNIESARNKLIMLLNKDFIDVFFEKLVQDDRRKYYWSKFIDKIDDIVFVGNRSNYRYLKKIDKISEFVESRYKITSRNQNTCALIIYSKGFVFVEFTDTGALYIYKQENFHINLNSISSMGDLKSLSNEDLISEERIIHSGIWEDRVDMWMTYYYD